jgi:hypothetical protein
MGNDFYTLLVGWKMTFNGAGLKPVYTGVYADEPV